MLKWLIEELYEWLSAAVVTGLKPNSKRYKFFKTVLDKLYERIDK